MQSCTATVIKFDFTTFNQFSLLVTTCIMGVLVETDIVTPNGYQTIILHKVS